jgi:ribosomal protein RSM22 (predicted rRNA methylase)
MRVPDTLSKAFGKEFEDLISAFGVENKLLPNLGAISSPRFLARSVAPHIKKLSELFNRTALEKKDQGASLDPYWKESSNPSHLRLTYFLYFMPSNLYRVASVWAELSRLGFKWTNPRFRAVEFGAGPASGACGIAAGERYAPVGLPQDGNWALIEQDKAVLNLGSSWLKTYKASLGRPFEDWGVRTFHRKLEPTKGFLPTTAPRFDLWLMSYYMNEIDYPLEKLASQLLDDWAKHLEDEGLVIMVEPALKLQSRRILELRKALLAEMQRRNADWMQILLPCLGHQACGALSNPEDWCHEEVSWWRPPYFKALDKMSGLDRKTLPFSYLVLVKSRRSREEILPALRKNESKRYRLVSPAHKEGKELEFFLCGQEGKQRARYHPEGKSDPGADIDRGDILMDAEIRGDKNSARASSIGKLV